MRTAAAVLISALAASAALAGPLFPPQGSISPSFKTLSQVEPRTPISAATTPGSTSAVFIISQPGSYYLTGNVAGESGKHGIYVGASDVTLDLNGFHVIGAPGSQIGVYVSTSNNVTIRNGKVSGWTGTGVHTSGTVNCTIEDITSQSNGGAGFEVARGARVRACLASGNALAGISTADHCTVTDSIARDNGGDGFAAWSSNTFIDCTSENNGGEGFEAFNTTIFTRCRAIYNTGAGYKTSDVVQIADSSASSNDGIGFDVTWSARIERCMAVGNKLHGIRVGSYSVIADNMCRGNGSAATHGAGIHIASTQSRVMLEGNRCMTNDVGIEIDGTNNIVVGNACTMNTTNFDIVANNRVGAVVTPPLSGAVLGAAGGAGAGTSDPYANFSY